MENFKKKWVKVKHKSFNNSIILFVTNQHSDFLEGYGINTEGIWSYGADINDILIWCNGSLDDVNLATDDDVIKMFEEQLEERGISDYYITNEHPIYIITDSDGAFIYRGGVWV